MKRIFALLLFAGVSLAAVSDDVSEPKLSADPLLKGYRPTNTYTYQYEACLTSGFPDTEQQYTGLKIICDTEFYIADDTRAFLKIKNPQLFEVNGTSDNCSSESLKISPVSEELAPLLEQPIKFEYKDGKIGKIYCNDEEPEYVLNIKRGILALIHHNFTKPKQANGEPRMYKNWEYGTHGLCENLYDVQYNRPETDKNGEMKISKTLNLNNCTGKPHFVTNVNTGIRCMKKNCVIIDEPLKISISTSCDLFGRESRFVVNMCQTSGRYIFAPTQMKGSAATIVRQILKFKGAKSGSKSYSVVSGIPHKLRMTLDHDEDDRPLTNGQETEIVTEIVELIKFLIKSVDQKDWKAYKFTALVEMLRKVDKDTLNDIWNQCSSDDQLRLWLLEALRYVYNQDAFKLIADKIKTQALKTNQAVPVLLGLALSSNPSEEMCQEISDLCWNSPVQEDENLKRTCYLTQGALMHEYCKMKGMDCLKDKAIELESRLQGADYQEKIFIVKLIGNFGHRSLYRPLLNIIEDTDNTLELRVTAVYALRRIAPRIPQKVLPVLLQIFRQIDNDAELRMACFVVICDSRPGPAVFNLIVKQLSRERSNQVRSFVVSYIKGMAFSRYPCDENEAKTARLALRMLRKHKMGFLTSKWLHWGQFSERLQLGGSLDLQMISTPSSFLPRALNSKVKVQVLGRSLNLFEAGVRGEGIQELLQRVVGPKPQSTETKRLLSKITQTTKGYEKEVKEINNLLPITQNEGEKTKGSFYFKVMGKELLYNYFTSDDIKELIDDEGLKVDNLKDLLTKGKLFNLTKAFLPVEVKFVQPSAVGIPLKFSLQSVLFLRVNSSVRAELERRFFIPLPDQVSLNGKMNISVLHSTWGKMKICLPQLETGAKMKLDIDMTAGMGGSLKYNFKEHSYATELELPREKQQIFSTKNQGYTYLMYTKPVEESTDSRSVYRSTPLDGLEIGEVAEDDTFTDLVEAFLFPTYTGETHRHPRYANWTLKTRSGKFFSINDQNELALSDKPTVFRVIFIDNNRQFVKLYVPGKGYVKVKPNSKGCLETVEDERYPKLFKITHVNGPRLIRLDTVVFIHADNSKNPSEWTDTTAPMNTDQVLLFKNMIEDMEPEAGYEDKWRYLTYLPLDDVISQERFHPRHMKLVFITPVQDKVCLRPTRSDETVFTVKRHHTNISELCYGEQLLGVDVCFSGERTKPLVKHARVFPFSGPARFNISIKPGKNPAHKIQLKFENGDRNDVEYKTWKAGMYLVGTNPEKKIESQITHDVKNKQTNFTFDMHNMLPWLRRVCITRHVISDAEARFYLKFGENCEQYQIRSSITIKEAGRRQVNVVASYNQLPDSVIKLFYKLFKAISRQYRDRVSDYKIMRSERSKVEFVVKFKTEQLVDLEFIMPSRVLTMDNVRIDSNGFIPRGNSLMNELMALSSPVCTVDYDTFKTFDDVEFQYTSPLRCAHVLTKDCVNNTFMVLVSKEADKPDSKIVEIFVEKQKIRAEYEGQGHYQIQVNGDVRHEPQSQTFRVQSVATIVKLPEKEELHVLCDNGLQVLIARGVKIDIRVCPFLFNRTCGMCGDRNAEQYLEFKTPRGLPYTNENKLKYGHMWMIPEDKCRQGRCHLKKEFVEIRKEIAGESHKCFPTTPVLRCLDECQVTESRTTRFPMTCVKTGSKESLKILREKDRRTLDLTESKVYYTENLAEHLECDCSLCGQ